jgi:DNA repair protein RadC
MGYKRVGSILNKEQEKQFQEWMEDGNVIEFEDGYSTQDAQYRNRLKDLDALRLYFYNEFIKGQYADGGRTMENIAKKQARKDIKTHLFRPQAPYQSIEKPSEEWERYELPYDTKTQYDFEPDSFSAEGKRYSEYATGGKVGDLIKFKNLDKEVLVGRINNVLGENRYSVSSGFGSFLVDKSNYVGEVETPAPRKKFLGIFADGGQATFDVTKLDLDNSISSRVYYTGVDDEINKILQNDYKPVYDFDKKGIEWVYKNTRYVSKDEDLIQELKEALAERNRGIVDMMRLNKQLPIIESKYGKDVNFAKKMHQQAKDFYQNKLWNEKSIRANEVFIDYLISRLKESKKEFSDGGEVEYEIKRVVNEAKNQNKNTHFAIHKPTNSIVFSWDYSDYDTKELNANKDDYFYFDVKDNVSGNVDKYVKSDFAIVQRKDLEKRGIDLNNYLVFIGQKYDSSESNYESDGREAGFDEAGSSMVMYHEKKGNFMIPKGQIYLYLYDVEKSGEKLQNGEFDWVFYPFSSISLASQSGFIPPLKKIWTKKFQKEHKGSEHLLGVIKAFLIDKDNGEKELYIDMMSVNPTNKKKGIMSYMIKDLRDAFNLSQDQVTFSQLTEEGKKFVAKKTYDDGGAIYPDLSLEKSQVVNDSIELVEFQIKKSKNIFTKNGIENIKITSSSDAVDVLKKLFEKDTMSAYEQAFILYLNANNKIIGYYHHSSGGIDGTVMDIQMISGMALKSLAKGVIISHNHPSENTKPSDADKKITEQLNEALKLFNVKLLDSIILTENSYLSFRDEGLI